MDLYQTIKQNFDKECDTIQIQTEELLSLCPKNDSTRRKEILSIHKTKLREAISKLNNNLKSI